MRLIRVTYDDGDTVTTRINGSEAEIRQHYIGQTFACDGPYDLEIDEVSEIYRTAVSVEFLD